jgi:peptidyl-tRNA hydrolase, PTH1 family
MIKLIVGLGNPGPEYEHTRHNAGFWWVDAAARELGGSLAFDRAYQGLVARVNRPHGPVWLLQPMTYMNLSGRSVGPLARFFKIVPAEILVVHDELDLLPGGIRIKQGGGAGGHNGIKDIQSQLGTPDFWRLRLGVGHPRNLSLAQEVADFVLHRPRAEEREAIDRALDRCLLAWPKLAAGDYAGAQQQLHGKTF